ncbi:flagellar hook-associated protein FlgL [Litoribrevibacter albus]|uniref:Flagellar hook-associated protein FlgL n=1 Tax=Litoribrevibacter albus TaxID=1473156 RepID=A0AA37SCU5_9GAMM|nr:flagellar hook-associated protein FlgL [Litoribrevibacter albus]GLQ32224.1 flagellar hook-associated protein FlgL [Litoribrevibacter albus]
MVRVSSQQAFLGSVGEMIDLNSQVLDTQAKISSGKEVLTAADDPLAASRISQLTQGISLREQYTKNLTTLEAALQAEESALNNIVASIQRVRELTVKAGNGSYSIEDRQSIAIELDQRLNELVALANTKDASGEYIFAGFQGDTIPFAEVQDGTYVYQGDEGQRFIKADESTNVARNDNGKRIFFEIESANNTVFTYANPLNTDQTSYISSGKVTDQEIYDAFYPEDMVITFNPETNIVPNGPNYTIVEKSTGKPVITDFAHVQGAQVTFNGASFTISGSPNPGDVFTVESSNKQDIFKTVKNLTDGLNSLADTPTDKAQLETLLNDTLINLDNALESVVETQSDVGGRLNVVDTSRDTQEEINLVNQTVLSGIRDLDYAEAVSQLSFQTFVLEATQSTFTRVSGLSLFNKL